MSISFDCVRARIYNAETKSKKNFIDFIDYRYMRFFKAHQTHVSSASWSRREAETDTWSRWQRRCPRHPESWTDALGGTVSLGWSRWSSSRRHDRGYPLRGPESRRVPWNREKHVAKPRRALTALNGTADEGWKRSTFRPPLSTPTSSHPLSLSSLTRVLDHCIL